MTASALTRPGERDRLSTKVGELDWRLIGLLCLVAFVGAAMLYSIAGGQWQPWAIKQVLRLGALVMLAMALLPPRVGAGVYGPGGGWRFPAAE